MANLFNVKRYFNKPSQPSIPSEPSQSVSPSSSSGVFESQGYSGIGSPPPQPSILSQPASPSQPSEPSSPTESAPPSDALPTDSPSLDPNLQKKVSMDVLTRLTQHSGQVLTQASKIAQEQKSQYLDTEHLLLALLSDAKVYQLLNELKIIPSQIERALKEQMTKGSFEGQPQFSPRVKKVLELAFSVARDFGYEFISPDHLLLALAKEGEGLAAKILKDAKVTVERLEQKMKKSEEDKTEQEKTAQSAVVNYTVNLVDLARQGRLDPVVERSNEIERIIHILSRRTKNNVALVGEAGVGKTAIAEGLAQRIAAGDVPETLKDKTILSLDLTSLIAGAAHRGEFEERLKNLLKEIQASAGGIILYIDELHNIVGAGGSQGVMDVSNMIKPYLARGELQTIGSTTMSEYRRYIEKDPALERRFQPVIVNEPTPEQAIEMVRALRDKYEAFHKVKITDAALEASVRLSHRYVGDRHLPDKAVDLIDEAASSVRLPAISLPEEITSLENRLKRFSADLEEAKAQNDTVSQTTLERQIREAQEELNQKLDAFELKKSISTNEVTPEVIEQIVSSWTKIPISRLSQSESQKLLKLEDELAKNYINQKAAVAAVSEAVRRGRAGLKSNKRPIGSFVFMGPTGVGKTELAKRLAENLFGSADSMIRIDMTEYMEKHEVAKLIGAPPGYVGYEEGGQLTEAVRRKPYSVLLLDEVEKAHPDVFNILIQLLDDGRLTDNKGRTISFKNTIVIATSNIGTNLIQESDLIPDFNLVQEEKIINGLAQGPLPLVQPSQTPSQADEAEKIQPLLDTVAIAPDGRQTITKGSRIWQRDNLESTQWQTLNLEEQFGPDIKDLSLDSHVIAPTGVEVITSGNRYWYRTGSDQEWLGGQLSLMFSGHQSSFPLPIDKINTWAITPSEAEIITSGNRFWKRQSLSQSNWETGTLSEYFKGADASKSTFEVDLDHWDAHVFTPAGEEIIFAQDKVFKRPSAQSPDWETLELKDYFANQTVVNADSADPSQQLPGILSSSDPAELPDNPDNPDNPSLKEIVFARDRYWLRPDLAQNIWQTNTWVNFFQNHVIKNPQDQEEKQFPQTVNTFTIYSDGSELITSGGRYLKRVSSEIREWEAGDIANYMANQKVANASPDEVSAQLPISDFDTWAAAPSGMEIISKANRFWQKTGENTWETGLIAEYFKNAETLKIETENQTDVNIQAPNSEPEPEKNQPFPSRWDAHWFDRTGVEFIVFGPQVWQKSPANSSWQTKPLKSLFENQEIQSNSQDPSNSQVPSFPTGEKELAEAENKSEQEEIQFQELGNKLLGELRKFFRPELLNRFDEVIVFRPLKAEHILQIVDLLISETRKLLEEQGIGLEVSENACIEIAKLGFDPIYGARPLRRAIQRHLENQISSLLIGGQAKAGDIVAIDHDGSDFVFNIQALKPPSPSSSPSQPSLSSPPEPSLPSSPPEVSPSPQPSSSEPSPQN